MLKFDISNLLRLTRTLLGVTYIIMLIMCIIIHAVNKIVYISGKSLSEDL